MKNFINYYYNLSIDNLRKRDNIFIFEFNGVEYEFLPYTYSLSDLSKIYYLLIQNNRYVHEIIYNKDNSIMSFCNNLPYVLIKKNYNLGDVIELETIVKYDFKVNSNFHLNWKELWQNKINYYEYQVKEIGFKYKNIKESFYYYLGLSELAISIINYINEEEIFPYISHRRIKYNETYDTFLNPLNIIIDTRVRDIAEYIKANFFEGNIDTNNLIYILQLLDINKSEALLLLSRLIYPSYYFDMYDKIIAEKIDNMKINVYIEKNVYFETFLKEVYKYFKVKYNIPLIEWFEY